MCVLVSQTHKNKCLDRALDRALDARMRMRNLTKDGFSTFTIIGIKRTEREQ